MPSPSIAPSTTRRLTTIQIAFNHLSSGHQTYLTLLMSAYGWGGYRELRGRPRSLRDELRRYDMWWPQSRADDGRFRRYRASWENDLKRSELADYGVASWDFAYGPGDRRRYEHVTQRGPHRRIWD